MPALPPASLDDAVTILLQLEPSDIRGFEQLRRALESVAAGAGLEPKSKECVHEAISQIDALLSGRASDGEDVLIAVSQLLETASINLEQPRRREPVKPAEERVEGHNRTRPPQGGPGSSTAEPGGTHPVTPSTPDSFPAAAAPGSSEIDRLPPDTDPGLLAEFVAESRELLEGAESALLALESDPENAEAVNRVFRAFHTIKGTSGFLGLARTSELAHHAESLLSRIRNGEARFTGGYADLALRSVDMIKGLVLGVAEALAGAPLLVPPGYHQLKALLSDPEAAGFSELPLPEGGPPEEVSEPEDPEGDAYSPANASVPEAASGSPTARAAAQPAREQQAAARTGGRFESSVRVSTIRLDRLIDMVGELVIAQSMVAQDRALFKESCHELLRKVTHAGKIVRELQDLSMSMRMVPLRATFQKMHRLVRDLAHKSGKKVNLIIEDHDTEIDRHMVDIINDLLVHMVRNAVDHGIELPEERIEKGKDGTGTVRLTAFHSGGTVVVEIKDDGRGLDREKILEKAVAMGLVDPDKSMSDNEIYNIIFAPGFSTAGRVTDISGRGVGMDVVRKGVEALHGRVDVWTVPGEGSTFSARLPLTLAITDGMLVRVGADRYIVPTVNIHLCFRPKGDQLSTVSGRGEMVLLRGELMPIFRLHRLFNIKDALEDPTVGLLVVVGDGERRCALLVDELLGQQQFVAKALGEGVGKVEGVSGGAILGDGKVGLILDPSEIAALARQERMSWGGPAGVGRTAA